MAGKCEDHMDLGGFLQTYVLGNPFQSPNANVSTSQKSQSQSPVVITPKQTKAKSKRKPSTEQRRDVTAPSSNGSGPVSPILIIPSMQNNPDSQSTVASSPDASSSQNEDPLIRIPDAPPMPVPISPPGGDNGVVGLGHVGSNAAYAASLEKRKVADAHRPVQSWLLMNYQFCPYVPVVIHCLYSNRLLLCEVQEQFPSTSSIVLSRIVKFTFPECNKIINKSGTFWQGLLKQPQVPSPSYINAAQALQRNSDWDEVLKSHKLTDPHDSLTVTSLLYWRDSQGQPLDLQYLEQLYREEFEDCLESSTGDNHKKHQFSIDERDPSPKQTPLDEQEEPKRKRSPTRKCKQRHRLIERFLKSNQNDSELSNEDANDEDYVPSQTEELTRPTRKRKKTKPVKRTQSKPGTGSVENGCLNLTVEKNSVETDVANDIHDSATVPKRKRSSNKRVESTSVSQVATPEVNTEPSVIGEICFENGTDSQNGSIIKDEPVDHTDEHIDVRSPNEINGNGIELGDKDENENCDYLEVSPIENGLHSVQSVDTSLDYKRCLAENKLLKTSLKSVQFKLSFSHNKTKQLNSELSKSQAEVKMLRSQLSDKESQLFELARDFSELSDSFKKFATKLQVAILGTSSNHYSLESSNTSDRDSPL